MIHSAMTTNDGATKEEALSFWITVTAVHSAVYIAGLLMFWRRRNVQPIKNMRSWLLFTCNCCLCLHSMSSCLVSTLAVGQPTITVLAPTLALFSFQNSVFDSFTMFAASLYFAYRRTHTQGLLADDASADEDKFDRRMTRIRRLSWMLSPQGIGCLMVISCFGMICLHVAYAYTLCQDVLTTKFIDAYLSSATFVRFGLVYSAKIIVQSVFVALLSLRLRLIVDKFGIKAILRSVAVAQIVGGVLYVVAVDPYLNAFEPPMLFSALYVVALIDCILLRSLVAPIYQTYLPNSDDVHVLGGNNLGVADFLERFLHSSERRFNAFRKQLEEELSVENLLFWRDAEAYRKTFPSPTSSEKAFLIWKTYITSGSPLEINISDSARRAFIAVSPSSTKVRRVHSHQAVIPATNAHVWPTHLLHRDVFRPACEQVVALMCDNALARFQRENPDIWDEFINETNECRFSLIEVIKTSKPATTREHSGIE